jgi:DNA-directed RNA polymerase subunit RPC12/RpoP
MRTWKQSTIALHCGACGKRILPGRPFLEFRFSQVKARKIRCPECAGEASPIPTGPMTAAVIHFGRFL